MRRGDAALTEAEAVQLVTAALLSYLIPPQWFNRTTVPSTAITPNRV